MHVLVDENTSCRGAVLTSVEEPGNTDSFHSLVDVGVVKHNDGCFSTELQVNSLEVGGGRLGHLHTRAHRAGDGDHLGNCVINHRRTTGTVSGDDIDNTGR